MFFKIWLKLLRFIPPVALFLGTENRSVLRDMLEDFRPAEPPPGVSEALVADNIPREVEQRLHDYGVAVIPRAVPPTELKPVAEELLIFAEQIQGPVYDGKSNPDISVVFGDHLDYSTLRDSERPIAVVRGGTDAGMVDIFHADAFLMGKGLNLRDILKSSGVVDTIETILPDGFELRNINAYINRGVESTRGFHVDSYGGNQVKAFVYLTDVTSVDDGPYCYVIGSHADSGFPILNTGLAQFMGKPITDVSAFKRSKALPLLGEAGTLLVSNQSGAHRGYPQAPHGKRAILALNFQRI